MMSKITDYPSSKLKRQVTKRLVEMNVSPKGKKMLVFHKLIADDKESKAAIDLVVKIQPSIEDAQNIVLNNCS